MARHSRLITLAGGVCAAFLFVNSARAAEVTVIVTANPEPAFVPKFVTIHVGDTIKWVAPDEPNSQVHNIVSDTDVFFSGFPQPPPWEFSFQFTSAGTFPYYCAPHGNIGGFGQSGVIFVRPARAANEIVYEKSAWDFHPGSAGIETGEGPEEQMRSISATPGGNELRTGVQLPAGAKISGLEITGCDDNATSDMEAGLVECPDPTGGCTLVVKAATTGQPGCGFFATTVADGPTMNNLANSYALLIQLPAADTTLRFRNVRVFYRRVLSAAPLTATFADVPTTHLFFRAIEALAASGITQGCGGGNYCPDDPVTRAAMAGFLARAFGLFFPN